MDYNFYSLNPRTFEQLIQALARKLLGNGMITFGDGPDGGREAVFDGKTFFAGHDDCRDGHWVLQAKFKSRADHTQDEHQVNFKWVQKEFLREMKKFASRKVKKGYPDNYLFFTNVVLTPAPGTGGRDKIEDLVNQYTKKIPYIKIFGYDDMCGFLDNNRDVATAYSSFILPGDILYKLYELLPVNRPSSRNHSQLLGRFLEAEFREDIQSRLDHAGKMTTDKVHLEKVFVDLYATPDGIVPKENDKDQKRFLELCLGVGNDILRPDSRAGRYVLTGGPGYGKSTMTQFLCQVYRAYFLKNLDTCATPLPEIPGFITEFEKIMLMVPTCYRFPVRFLLKDFAGWLAEQKAKKDNHTLLMYLKYRLEKKGPGTTIEIGDIEQLLGKLSFVFIFDGLDEVPATSNREEVLTEIRSFIEIDLRRCDGDALIIATTRPQGYTNEFDRSGYSHLTLADLPARDCLTYLDRLLTAIDPLVEEREKHLDILKNALDHDITSNLMKTPLQVSIMAILVKSGGEPPRYKYDLFTEYYHIILKRERQKNVCRVLNENPGYIDHIHNRLGYFLQLAAEQKENPAAHISREEFGNLIAAYLRSLGVSKEEVEALTGQIIQAVMERLVFLEEVVEGRVGFNIRSLQEYFAANYYIKDQEDEIIRKRLKYLCKSAYWRNTFLFVLGYIGKERKYLVDTVESICRELNGSVDLPGHASGSAVCKLGSWLALEILVEGIFKGLPNYENKFANLLEDLFIISPSYKHSRFGSLSNDLNEKWVLPFIGKYTSHSVYEEQLAGWTIGIYLLKHKFAPVKAVLDKNWPIGSAEVKLVKNFINLKVNDDQWFMEKFLSAFKRNPFFEDLYRNDFIYNAVLSPANDFNTRRIWIQEMFRYGIPEFIVSDYMEKAINTDLGDGFEKKHKKGCLTGERMTLYDEGDKIAFDPFNTGLTLVTYRVKSSQKDIEKLSQLFSSYKIDYLERLIQFLKLPCKNNLKELFTALKDEPHNSIVMIKEKFQRINWLLQKILNEEENLDKILQNIDKNQYGDVEDWQEFEQKITQKDMAYEYSDLFEFDSRSTYIPMVIDNFKSFFMNYYEKLKNNPHLTTKQILYQEFFECIAACFSYRIVDFKRYLNRNESIITELLSILKKIESYDLKLDPWNFNSIIFGLLYFLTDQEIMKIEEQDGELIEKFKFQVGYYQLELIGEVIPAVFSRFSIFLNHALAFNRETGFIRVPVWGLLQESLRSLPPLEFNFNDLHQAIFKNPDNETSRILLCLVDPGLDRPKALRLAEIVKQHFKTTPQLPRFIIRLIEKYGLKGDWVEAFLLEVYKGVDRHDHDIKTAFENYFKDMLDSLPSHLNDSVVQKELKL